ncbi:hypothetical protein [Geothermobacter ehrlichii]|uniref:hypothetical protein n=1 Tax=Geothermobacter ehrlichii TaxID=213224 RepID=UPI0011E86DA3|nr:hypothetical protein [Geothermobacter ehrlichii]
MLTGITYFVATVVLIPLGFVFIASALKLIFSDRGEYERIHRRTKWKLGAALKGQLHDGYALGSNYLIKEGLAIGNDGQWISQSAISDEAIEKITF